MATSQPKARVRRNHIFRTKLLILPKFQLVLIGINLAIILGVSLLIWVSMENALMDLKPAAGLSGMEVEVYKHYLDYQSRNFQMALFLSLVLGVVTSGILTLVISHRLSGPLLRLRKFFTSIGQGEEPIPQLEFRDGDFLSDLPPIVNQAIARLESRHAVVAPTADSRVRHLKRIA